MIKLRLTGSGVLVWCIACALARAQVKEPRPGYPTRLPYAFTNFVWWTDAELRADLKKQMRGLTDEIAPDSAIEGKMRVVLAQLLKEKGITAEVQTQEPPPFAFTGQRDPDAPPPAILFSVLSSPQVVIGKITLENAPPAATDALQEQAIHLQGESYEANTFWSDQKRMKDELQQRGYLGAAVAFQAGPPKVDGPKYVVPLNAAITSGPQYHVASIKADGGPLLQGKDLSPYLSLKPGDIATPYAFGRLIGSIRSLYWHAGYPDVDFRASPALDETHALAAYSLEVVPGPLFHLRSLKMEGLSPEQQARVQTLLGMKVGDIYDAFSVASLNRKLSDAGPTLQGYGLTYSPKEDKQDHVVDLTFSFYKQ